MSKTVEYRQHAVRCAELAHSVDTFEVKTTLIVGACVMAPVFEEFLFRGHIQTLLVRMFMLRPRPPEPLPPLGYVFPGMSRALRPVLERRGAAAKARYAVRAGR